MKFSEFLVERKQEQIYGYHATDRKNLQSILKKGLVPNHNEGGYGSSETSDFGVPLTPHPAVYLTRDAGSAVYIAKSEFEHGVVLIVKVTPNSLTMDEDNIGNVFDLRYIYKRMQSGISPDELWNDLESAAHDIFRTADPRYIQALKNDVIQYFKAFKGITQFDDSVDLEDGFDYNAEYNKAEKIFKQAEFNLSKKLRGFVKGSKSIFAGRDEGHYERTADNGGKRNKGTTETFKVDGEIGFSGRNRIVGIYDFMNRSGWGDLGNFEGSEYHKYKTPMEMVKKD